MINSKGKINVLFLCRLWWDKSGIHYTHSAVVGVIMHTLFKFSHCPTQDCLLVHHWTILSSAVIFKSLHGSLLWLLALTHLRMCTGFPPACRNSDLVLEFQLGENDIVSYSEMNHVSRAGRDQNLLTASIQQKSGTCPQFNSLHQISPSQKPTPRLAFRS